MKSILHKALARYGFLSILIILYALYFSIYTVIRYHSFYAGEFDLGNMNQTVWNTLHGHFFMESDPAGTLTVVSRISDHVDLLLLSVIPFYYFFPHVETLLIFQSLIVALGAVPVFLLARDITKKTWLSTIFAFIYLMMPGVQNANIFEFHAVTIGATFMLFSFYFLWKKKYLASVPFIILTMLAKEEVGFTITCMLCYFLVKENLPDSLWKQWKVSGRKLIHNIATHTKQSLFLSISACIAFCYPLIVVLLIVPKFRHGSSLYLKDYYYGRQGIVLWILTHPVSLIQQQGYDSFHYLIAILAPSGFLAILAPFAFLISLPEILLDTLSTNHFMQSIHFQYAAMIEPFVIVATILGFVRCSQLLQKRFSWFKEIYLVAFMLLCVMICSYAYGSLPYSYEYKPFISLNSADTAEVAYLQKTIPESASIIASNNVGAQFSSRYQIYTYLGYGLTLLTADYLILKDDTLPSTPQGYTLIYSGTRLHVYRKIKQS